MYSQIYLQNPRSFPLREEFFIDCSVKLRYMHSREICTMHSIDCQKAKQNQSQGVFLSLSSNLSLQFPAFGKPKS